ncbi:hypothetical protein ACQPUR_22445, partial [Clostridium neonatale]|uniref:hypothetical protein n=1 Tax=Clostridium neonatale TaxID=137838 RepID=UPI003D346594
MNKNIKKMIALIIALTSVCSIGNITGVKLFEEANAAYDNFDAGELKDLSVKTIEGEEVDLLSNFDEDDVVKYNRRDNEYKIILPKDSDGIRVSASVKSDDNKADDEGGKYVVKVFTSDKGDAKAYDVGDDLEIDGDSATIYVRTYKSKSKFNDLKNDGRVTQCAESYKITVKREGSISKDEETGTANSSTSIVLPKINVTDIAKPTETKNQWVKKGDYWLRYNEEGQALRNAWFNDSNGKWYYMQANGYMTTGWRFIDGDWYYFDGSGAMTTGWVKTEDGTWYYLKENGKMARNETINGYRLNSKGEYIK